MYYAYSVEVKPCPQCVPCPDHEGRVLTPTGKRYWRVEDDGKRVELTKEEWDKRGTYRYRDQPGNRPG